MFRETKGALPVLPAGLPAGDPRCVRCGYSLIGLEARRPCPECGLLVGFSLHRSEELRHAHATWLAWLAAGAAIAAVGMAIAPFTFLGSLDAGVLLRISLSGFLINLAYGSLGFVQLAAALLVLSSGAKRFGLSRRARVVRGVAIALPLFYATSATALAVGQSYVAWPAPPLIQVLGFVHFIGTVVIAAALAIVSFRYLRYLAERAPAPLLAGDSARYGFFLAGALLMPAPASLLVWLLEPFDPKNALLEVWLFILIAMGAAAVTAYLWGIYLLVRYALAFLWARRQAKALIREFDASLNPQLVVYDPPP